jgi:hypothetical protein
MLIVLMSESLLRRSIVSDGRILRGRLLCGFCVRMHPSAAPPGYETFCRMFANIGVSNLFPNSLRWLSS